MCTKCRNDNKSGDEDERGRGTRSLGDQVFSFFLKTEILKSNILRTVYPNYEEIFKTISHRFQDILFAL
jgi:hypothetical protein